MKPIRPAGSVELDARRRPTPRTQPDAEATGDIAPFVAWPKFYPRFSERFEQGQHVTAVGRTGSGKTVLLRHVAMVRTYVVVFATKVRDASLYDPLEQAGFEITPTFHSDPLNHPRLILRPPLSGPGAKAIQAQGDVFEDALNEIWTTGEWCVFADEVRYLTGKLRLGGELETLWLQGRSMGVSLVVATQRPVSVPLEAFSMADHFFFFAEHEKDNVQRMSEFAGQHQAAVRDILPHLPKHEVLYVNTTTGYMCRTKVTGI